MRVFFIAVFISLTFFQFGQNAPKDTYKAFFEEGLYLLLEGNHEAAQENFEAAYKLDSSSANINYVLGVCYINSAQKKAKAEHYFSKSIYKITRNYKADSPDEKSAPPLAILYYGKSLHINYKFDEAIKQFDDFSFRFADTKELKKLVAKERATSILAKEIVANPLNIKIQNMGDSINSKYPEYAPVLSADEKTLIFTTRRPNSTGGLKTPEGEYFEDIVVCYKDDQGRWSKPIPLPGKVNTIGHEGSINLTPDGQTLIVFRDDAGDGNIYYSTFEGKEWSELKDFGTDVNSKYFESHACLNADASILFYSSDRPGGFGGRDIYRCIKLPNGKWSKSLNLGSAINTEYDEDGAFMHPDSQTFFFSSEGPKSMGAFDVFFATLNEDNKFTDITNIGYPINTTDDDIFYVTSPDGKRAYISSDKEGGFGEKDIYMISIPDSKEANLALFKGRIVPALGEQLPENLMITVTEKGTGKVVGTYMPKLENGTFATILPPGQEYNFSYRTQEGEEFYTEDIFVTDDITYKEIKKEVNLEPVKITGKVKAVEKAILLNVVTLENAKTKNVVAAAKITVETEGQAPRTFESDAKGKYDGIELQKDRNYSISAVSGEKKSEISSLSTAGVKSGKVINQIVYLATKPKTVTSKELLLGVVVRNSRTLKIVPNASITLTSSDGENYDITTNDKGEVEGIELSRDTKYEIRAKKGDGAISEMQTLSTKGKKGKQKFTKTLLIDDEGEPTPDFKPLVKRKKITSRDLLLAVIVRSSKTYKIIPNVKIRLVDADGEYYDITTNARGEVKGIELSRNTKYEVLATNDQGASSKKQSISTEGVKGKKSFSKTLYIDQEPVQDTTPVLEVFETHYKYNVDNLENENGSWKAFINQLVTLSKAGTVNVFVKTSASKVPTKKYGTNENLANSRATNLVAKIKSTVITEGGKDENINYTKSSEVGGPEYRRDAIKRRAVYEKYQFGRAEVK